MDYFWLLRVVVEQLLLPVEVLLVAAEAAVEEVEQQQLELELER